MLTQTKRAAYITRCCASSQHIKGFKLVEIEIHSSMIIYVSNAANGELASMVNVQRNTKESTPIASAILRVLHLI